MQYSDNLPTIPTHHLFLGNIKNADNYLLFWSYFTLFPNSQRKFHLYGKTLNPRLIHIIHIWFPLYIHNCFWREFWEIGKS